MLEEKDSYTIQDLFDSLAITLAELADKSNVNETTLARIRDGKPARRATANKLLQFFSEYYGRVLTVRNVAGINIQDKRKKPEGGSAFSMGM